MLIKQFNRLLILLTVAVFCGLSMSTSEAAYYTDLSVEYLNMRIEGNKLHPLNGRIKLGAPVSREVSFEANYAESIDDDEINGLKLEQEETMGLYMRYNGPDAYGGMTIYLLAGYAWTTIKTSGLNAIPNQEFESFSWGAGVEERSRSARNLRYTFQYTRYFDDNGLTIDGLSLGVRFDF